MRAFAPSTSTILLGVVSLAVLVNAGCSQRLGASGGGASARDERTAQLKEFQRKRESREKELKAMDVKQLAAALTTDSQKAREPFNSPAYREMIKRGEAAAAELKPLITERDRSSLLGLLALRKLSAAEYQSLEPAFRCNVLVGSLSGSKYFNTWGVPNFYWEDAGKAIIDEGDAAVEPLVQLLSDTRPAPVFGSEGTITNARYHFRVCDYALAFLNEIRKVKTPLPTDAAARDSLIKAAAKKP